MEVIAYSLIGLCVIIVLFAGSILYSIKQGADARKE